MALVPRQRKNKIVYYVANKLPGAKSPTFERVGTDKREAERRDAAMKKEIKAGVYVGKSTGGKTFAAQMVIFLATRQTRTVEDDERKSRIHLQGRCEWFTLLRLEDIRKAHVERLANELRQPYTNAQGKTKPIKLRNLRKFLNVFFKYCRGEEMMLRNPMEGVPRKAWGPSSSKKRKPYEASTVIAMTTDDRLPPHWRMLFTLLFYTGARIGEVCGLQFRDYDRGPKPFGCLTVSKQYNHQPLKGGLEEDDESTRKVPVLPFLAAAIDAWWATGFEQVYCRKPTPQDFIVPRKSGKHQTRHAAYEWFQEALRRLALNPGDEPTPMHAARNTFISLALRAGARKEVLQKVTHSGERGEGSEKRTEIDAYVHYDWDPLCIAASYFMSAKPLAEPAPELRYAV